MINSGLFSDTPNEKLKKFQERIISIVNDNINRGTITPENAHSLIVNLHNIQQNLRELSTLPDIINYFFDKIEIEIKEYNSARNSIKVFLKNTTDFTTIIYNSLQQFQLLDKKIDNKIKTVKELLEQNINEELNLYKQHKNLEQNIDAYEYYNNQAEKFKKAMYTHQASFVMILLLIVLVALNFSLKSMDLYSLLIVKIPIFLAIVSLEVFFLQQANHYQRLAEQCEQTALELKALPSFLASVPTEQINEVRVELAKKYFGRDLLQQGNSKNSPELVEHIKASTELLKATAETIKSVKSIDNGKAT